MFDAGLNHAETLGTASGPVRAIAFTGDGTGLLVATSSERTGLLTGLRAAGGAPAFSLPLPVVPAALGARGDGRSYVVTGTLAGDSAGVAAVLSIVGEPNAQAIPACLGSPVGFVLGPDGDRLYATCSSDRIAEIDLRLRRRIREGPLTPQPTPANPRCDAGPPAAGQGSALLFIPCRGSGTILKVDRVTLQTVDAVDVGVAGVLALARGPAGTLVALGAAQPPVLVPLDRSGRPAGTRIELPGGARQLTTTGDPAVVYVSGVGPDGGWLARVELPGGVVRVAAIPAGHTAVAAWPGAGRPVMWFAKSLGDKNNPGH